MKILITGHTGQVARELQRALAGHELLSLGRADFDLAQPQRLGEVILRERPALVINAAAYTAVDQAEQERELAFTINAEAPGAMADACFELDIPLIHYSTDYVFDGSKATPTARPTHRTRWASMAPARRPASRPCASAAVIT